MIDFSEPGLLGVFTDEASISRLEKTMKRTGFLPKEEMQRSFNLLRTNDLIWNYAVSSWLMGEEPPTFDLLSWNNDSTRMPAEMHSFYLRSCYVENELAAASWSWPGSGLILRKLIKICTSSRPSKIALRLWRLVLGAAARWKRTVRALKLRAHRRHREPAQPEVHSSCPRGRQPTAAADPSDWLLRRPSIR